MFERRYLWIVLRLLLFAVPWGSENGFADEQSTSEKVSASADSTSADSASADSSMDSSSVSEAGGHSGVVPPLDPWLGKPIAEPQSVSSSSSSSSERHQLKPATRMPEIRAFDDMTEEEKIDLGIDDEEAVEHHSSPGEKPVVESTIEKIKLSKAQEKRLIKSKLNQRKRALAFRRLQRQATRRDPRGEPEIRICGVNLNAYGLPEEVKRIEHRIVGRRFAKREKSFLSAILEARCDLVALQGIVGRSPKIAQEGLVRLVKKLETATEKSWLSFLSESNHSFAYNAFVGKTDVVQFATHKTYFDVILPRFDQFQEKKFARGPFELTFQVAGKEERERKSFVVMTDYLRNSINLKVSEPVTFRMQMADAIRQLHQRNEQSIDPEDPQILMLIIDRADPKYSPTAEIIEGRLRLTDFRHGGKCVVDQNNYTTCQDSTRASVSLYPLLAGNVVTGNLAVGDLGKQNRAALSAVSEKTVKQSGKKLAVRQRTRSNEIYLPPPEVRYAWISPYVEGQLKVGEVVIENGLDNSPLAWVELNW